MEIEVRADVWPSEDREKVMVSVKNIFPNIDFDASESGVQGESTSMTSLDEFRNLLGLQAIRNSARRELKKGRSSNCLEFSLNKQAAMVKKVSFSDGNTPLGSIDVRVDTDRPDDLIDYLAPHQEGE
ncbi:MAG: RNA-binding domain-containing protein [Candidatus Hadarchaeota archaeon]